jgi:hypothetical protein
MEIPFTSYRVVRSRDVEQLLERMRINVPSSIRESERTLSDRDRIMAEARAEAERIVQEARQQASEMITEQALLASAQQEAERIVKDGEAVARQRTEEADAYAIQVLQELADKLHAMYQQVQNGVDLLQGTPEPPPAEPPAPAPARKSRRNRKLR